VEQELDAELRFHVEQQIEENLAAGMPPAEARYAAYRTIGSVAQVEEECRDMRGINWIENFVQDIRYAARMLVKNPGFTAVAVLSLALGIGANTAIYSFMDSILLRALPVRDPGSLVVLNWHAKGWAKNWQDRVVQSMSGSTWGDSKLGVTSGIFPFPAFELFQKSDAVFSSVFAYCPTGSLNLTSKGQSDLARGEYISGDYFRGLAVPPVAGRLIIPDDDRAGAPAVAVISAALSQRRFGGPANATGQSILLNNIPFTVVGVTPPEFFGVDPAAAPELYLPLHTNLLLEASNPFGERAQSYLEQHYYWIEMMGRVRPGVGIVQAQSSLAPPFQQWVASTATNDRQRANLPALVVREGAGGLDHLRRKYSKPLYVLMMMVGLILIIACANVANLLLARAAGRRREIALRLSVGAGRFRIIRQMLTESVLLASFGGGLGVLFAVWGIRFLTLLLANGKTNFTLHAELNWDVLGVTVALSLLTGILFGLAPAMQSTRVDVTSALKETQAGQPGGWRSFRRVSLSQGLVVAQIAVSLLMLVAAGLFVRTLSNLQSIEVGFNRENVLLFELDARKAGHKDPEIAAFYGDLQKRFSAIPGVRNASLSNSPLIEAGHGTDVSVRGKPVDPANRFLTVGPAFFTTMQIPILAGREIEERDHAGSPAVGVINEVFAKANFGDENPLGQHLTFGVGASARDIEIVGVSKNTRYGGLKRDIPPVVYVPYDQGYPPPRDMAYALRTAGDPLAYVNTVREIVRQADTRVPLANVKTQSAEIEQTINQEIVFAELCTVFAMLALVIACVGLYGMVSHNVARRTGEIGIRMALGAQRASVVRMILGQVFVLAAVGLAIGMPTALGTSKFVESFLFGLKPNDPLALTLAVVTLLGAALLAGYAPARRASRIDPMVALRHE
jgi:macrolide transport system ATP-binding/permease protein